MSVRNEITVADEQDVAMVDAVETKSLNDGSDSGEYVEFWIDLFLGKKGHEYFCEVDAEYITDRFNLINLQKTVSKFTTCLLYTSRCV